MHKNKMLFAFDLDGTIIGDNGVFSSNTIIGIRNIRKIGNIVLFVTGRREANMGLLGNQRHEADYIALNNGGTIKKAITNEVLYESLVPPEQSISLINYCLRRKIRLDVLTDTYWGTNILRNDILEYASNLGIYPSVYHSFPDIPIDEICSFTIVDNFIEVTDFIERNCPELQIVMSEPNCADIMPISTSKWGGNSDRMST